MSYFLSLFFGLTLLWQSLAWGNNLFPRHRLSWRLFLGFLNSLGYLVASSALVYYFYHLDLLTGLLILVILSIWPLLWKFIWRCRWPKFSTPHSLETELPTVGEKTVSLLLNLVFIIGWLAFFLLLDRVGTTEAIRSPWAVTPKLLFFNYLLLASSFVAILLTKQKTWWKITITALFSFASLAVTSVVYRLGYGYDPFIHAAAEQVILEQGFILPKTPYYLGQYGLVFFISQFFNLSPTVIGQWLIPILTALLLPPTVIYGWQNTFQTNHRLSWLITALVWLLPYPLLISSTPQSLANLFFLLVVFLGLGLVVNDKFPASLLAVLSVAAAVTHPLAGIPLLIFLAFLLLDRYLLNRLPKQKLTHRLPVWLLLSLLGVVGGLALPFVFLLNRANQLNAVDLWLKVKEFFQGLLPAAPWYSVYDWLDRYPYLIALLMILLAIGGGVYWSKQKKSNQGWPWLLGAGVVLLNTAWLSFFNLDLVISYEQENISLRLIQLATYLLLPLAMVGLYRFLNRYWLTGTALRLTTVLMFTLFLTSAWYLSYPRLDPHYLSKGYSTSAYDFTAVKAIAIQEKQPYLALANQAVSAAAVATFGFKPEYQGYYFYPIPTGGPLYQLYLMMVYQAPTYSTMVKALDLLKVDVGYLVVNDYWDHSDAVIEQAKIAADSWELVGPNKIYIFKYTRK